MIDDFMDFIGFRNMLVEAKIDECLDEARYGETDITVDRGDLTDDEVRYVQREVKRRLEGDY